MSIMLDLFLRWNRDILHRKQAIFRNYIRNKILCKVLRFRVYRSVRSDHIGKCLLYAYMSGKNENLNSPGLGA